MGDIITVRPLSQVSPPIALSSQQQAELLAEWGLPVPQGLISSRHPTPEDVQAVFGVWEGMEVSYGWTGSDFWARGDRVDAPGVTLRLGLDDVGSERYAIGGIAFHDTLRDVVVEVSERLARRCGPLLIAEYDEFLVVQAGTPPDQPWLV